MKKLLRKVAILMAVFTMLFSSLTAYAASPTELFDAEYYAKENPDVVAVYGNNPEKLYQHYMNYGIKEGRSLNSLFDVKSYRDRYSDLKDAFGDNWSLVLNHMLTYGLYEGRNTVDKDLTSLTTEQALTIYAEQVKARYEKDGLDENFAYFNVEEYKAAYPDLQEAFGDNVDAYLNHYLTYGIKEGRISGTSVDPVAMIKENPSIVMVADRVTPEQIVITNTKLKETSKETVSTPSVSITPSVPTCEHIWDEDFTMDVEPTCVSDGYKSIHCTKCNAKKDGVVVTTEGHDYGIGEMVKPTCTTEGRNNYPCKNCDYVFFTTSPATGHSNNGSGVCDTCGETIVVSNEN